MAQIRSYRIYYISLIFLLALFFIAEMVFGSLVIPLNQLCHALLNPHDGDAASKVLWMIRLPRACTALLAGIALSVSGVQMQTLFRNPLADPYVLGISSGAGLGVALFVMGFSAGIFSAATPWIMNLGTVSAAWMGSLAVCFLVMIAAKRLRNTMSLLILGIMIGSVGSALISMLQSFSSAPDLKLYVLWTLGSFANVTGTELIIMAIVVVLGVMLSVYNIKDLNVLLLGEVYAKSLGIQMTSIRRRIFIATALLAGSVTAFCGPIGFIGIAVPHLSRMIFKNANHKVLIPSSALLGATMMLFADFISQISVPLPINTVVALLGLPVIILIIIQNRHHE